MSSVNLLDLFKHGVEAKTSIDALEKLANSTEGPLRVKYKNGAPYLGIRTWKTFFLESRPWHDLDTADIEKQTAEVVDNYVVLFFNNLKRENEKCDSLDDATIKKNTELIDSAEKTILKLQAKLAHKSLKARSGTTIKIMASTTKPDYKNIEVASTSIKTFKGKVIVQEGLSLGPVPIDKVMADYSLSLKQFIDVRSNSGRGQDLNTPPKQKVGQIIPSEDDYRIYYLSCLTKVPESAVSVAIQLMEDIPMGSSEANRNGAWQAASEFIKLRKKNQKSASVLLCVKNPVTSQPKTPQIANSPKSKVPVATNSKHFQGKDNGVLILEKSDDDELPIDE